MKYRLIRLLAGLSFAMPLLAGADTTSRKDNPVLVAARPPLVVVLDNNYPPYTFLDDHGSIRGILPEHWALWSERTGRKVDLRPMPWAEAQRVMQAGGADVIDTVFMTSERARTLAFSKPYARIRVPVYAHKSLGGLGDTAALKGFMIGVKDGDAVIGHLQGKGIDTLKIYPCYEEIVLAAKRSEIKVFSIDEPAAVHYLYKHGIAGDFNQLFVLYTGAFRRAVARDNPELLDEVQAGFDQITAREYRAIQRKWMGSTFLLKGFLQHWAPWLVALAATLLLLLAAGNVILGRRVRAKTAELRQALADVQQSLDARMRAEEEKAEMQRQLTNVQRLESIGRLAGAVAHDFNNVLQAILGYAELALEDVPPENHDLRSALEEIRNSALSSSNLTRQLQAFARRQPVAPRPVDVNFSIESMRLLRRLLGSDIKLEWHPAPDLGTVLLDPGQIDQIVVNLCINSRDAMKGSGTIWIETHNVRLSPEESDHLKASTPGDYVRLTIRDNGPGIPADILDRIFDPFFTTKPSDKGTGLGLAIVYAIVRQSGGGIRVESMPEKGTAFHIFLPRCNDMAHDVALDDTQALTGPRRSILLVDDDENVLLTTRNILRKLGYEVHALLRPYEAIAFFDEHAAEIDLLLTDMVMPGMNGPELARRLRQRRPDLRCIFMTGHSFSHLEEMPEEDACDCLPKPFTAQTLARHVSKALAKDTEPV